MNSTSSSFFNHGDPNIICTAATAWSTFVFFLTNYIAHCVTLKTYPGEDLVDTAVAVFLALCFPASGIIRALDALQRHSRFTKGHELQRAARAGALVTIVRNKYWGAEIDDIISDLAPQIQNDSSKSNKDQGELEKSKKSSNLEGDLEKGKTPAKAMPDQSSSLSSHGQVSIHSPYLRVEFIGIINDHRIVVPSTARISKRIKIDKVHGSCSLPDGYSFGYVPGDAIVTWYDEQRKASSSHHKVLDEQKISIASNYNVVGSIVAIAQVVNAAFTLYKSRGNQIAQYGFAAFGLTVTPYLVMSILNLLAQIATPDFPLFYMIHSAQMDEARRRGGMFDGVIGTLVPLNSQDPMYRVKSAKRLDNDGQLSTKAVLERMSSANVETPQASKSTHAQSTVAVEDKERPSLSPDTNLEDWQRMIFPSCDPFVRTGSRKHWYPETQRPLIMTTGAPIIIGLVSLLVNGCLSKFQYGHSTSIQRGWTMSWLIFGMASGALAMILHRVITLLVNLAGEVLEAVALVILWVMACLIMLLLVGIACAPAIGGFVTVGLMLKDYGICETVG